MALFGRQADSSSGGGTKIPVRRRLAAGFVGLAALVSVVSVAANPSPDLEPAEQGDAPELEILVDDNRERVANVRLAVRCALDGTCEVDVPNSAEDIGLCPGACEDFDIDGDNWHSVLVDGTDVETEFPVVRGIVRVGDFQRDVVMIDASAPLPSTDFLEVRQRADLGTFLEFERVGSPGITFARSNAVDRTTTTTTTDDGGFAWWSLLGVAAVATLVGFGAAVLFGFYVTLRTLLDDGVRYRRGSSSEPDNEEEQPVTELEQPITYEMAQERVAVVRDLLDKVREEPDPRRSIQAGFATLESGFGRANMVRGNNETAAAYVRRILGSSEGLREPLGDIVALFERARFSDLPVDASMRLKMIERLEEVQRDWERRAIELVGQAPAAPAGVPVAAATADPTVADELR